MDIDNEWVAQIAILLNITAMLPQIYHVYSHQSAKSLSYMWLVTSIIANILWFYYGYYENINQLMRLSGFFTGAYIVLLFMKLRFG